MGDRVPVGEVKKPRMDLMTVATCIEAMARAMFEAAHPGGSWATELKMLADKRLSMSRAPAYRQQAGAAFSAALDACPVLGLSEEQLDAVCHALRYVVSTNYERDPSSARAGSLVAIGEALTNLEAALRSSRDA